MLNPDMTSQEMRLHMGELTADEVLVARAAIRWANAEAEAEARWAQVRALVADAGGTQ